MNDNNPTDPKENPTGTGHLPVSGEVGVGQVPYHDPVTTDTNDNPAEAPSVETYQSDVSGGTTGAVQDDGTLAVG